MIAKQHQYLVQELFVQTGQLTPVVCKIPHSYQSSFYMPNVYVFKWYINASAKAPITYFALSSSPLIWFGRMVLVILCSGGLDHVVGGVGIFNRSKELGIYLRTFESKRKLVHVSSLLII